jgi:hypothetical protein
MLIIYLNHYFRKLFMIINCHKINLSIQRNIFWVPKSLIGYFEVTLHAGITFRVDSSPEVT